MALHPDEAVLDAERARMTARASSSGSRSQAPDDAELLAPDTETFLAALRAQNGNVKRPRRSLGISRGRAYRMMEKIDALDLAALRRGDSPRADLPPRAGGMS